MLRCLYKGNLLQWFYNFLILLIVSGAVTPALGQNTTFKYLYVVGAYAGSSEDYLTDEYKWKVWVNNSLKISCLERNGGTGWYTNMNIDIGTGDPIGDIKDSPVKLTLEAWESDGCGPTCTYDDDCSDSDDLHCDKPSQHITLYDYEPLTHHSIDYYYCNNDYGIRYEFAYNQPTPKQPVVSTPSSLICNGNITLSTDSYLKSNFLSGTDFLWYYKVNGTWFYLGKSDANVNAGKFSISVNDFRLKPGISDINVNTIVNFSVKSRYTAGDGTSDITEKSPESDFIQISPAAPTINILQIDPSCPNAENPSGVILATVDGLFSSDYLYNLKSTSLCPPGIPCFNTGGRSYWNYVYAQGIPAGSYTLQVTNPGGDFGVCGTSIPVTVGSLPVLQLSTTDISHVSCQGGSDGAITLGSSGGIQTITYQLSGNGFSQTNTTGIFESLIAGSYTSKIKDGCKQEINTPLTVFEPVRVNAVITTTYPSCNSPADGTIQMNITGGNGSYIVKLMSGTEVVRENHLFRSSALTYENVLPGEYTLEIKDPNRLQCDGFSQVINMVSPPSLQIPEASVIKTDVSCYGRSDGSIQLNNVNITGAFKYILTNQVTGSSTTLTTSSQFSGLPPGNYTMTMTRNIEGCLDHFDFPEVLTIAQPEQVAIALTKQDISCYGKTDGQVSAAITGITPSDQYMWDVQLGGTWATLNNSGAVLENLSAATYRMRLTNVHNCSATSEDITVIEPEVLTISTFQSRDIVCYGSKGHIETVLQGGVTPYSYTYTSPEQTINSNTSITLLDKGVYTLLAQDVNGCTVSPSAALTITEPPAPLTMSVTSSNYHGYNISCHGASDGFLDVRASGGNGDRYAGYEYALNDRPFVASSRIENISEGDYTLHVRDGRGCLIHTPIVMTGPAANLQAELVTKQDAKCLGDTDGFIQLKAQGGLAPYTYILNNSSRDDGTFSSLAPGGYNITISDRNNCKTEFPATIGIQALPMDIQLQYTHIQCPGGSDGTITANVNGGAAPINYAWSNNQSSSNITGLRAGEYNLVVTDLQGCVQRRTVALLQPKEFSIDTHTVPVCTGKENGEITLGVSGGTPAYRYSVDDGVNYQVHPHFLVGAGTYAIRVKDSHDCEATALANITTRNDQPRADFIVATTQQVSDTLVIKEISVPKPDSIQWTFDRNITVLNNDMWGPVVTIKEAGNYTISMRGFFGGCDYSNTLTLTINPFDPGIKIGKDIPVSVIKNITVTPNPTDGHFNVSVELSTKQHLSVVVYDMLGVSHYQENWNNISSMATTVDISNNVSPGMYVVRAVTDTDARDVLLAITK